MTLFLYISLDIVSKTVSCFLNGVGRGRMTRQNVSHLTQMGSHWRQPAYTLLSDIISDLIQRFVQNYSIFGRLNNCLVGVELLIKLISTRP
jgi:hypothetical protein